MLLNEKQSLGISITASKYHVNMHTPVLMPEGDNSRHISYSSSSPERRRNSLFLLVLHHTYIHTYINAEGGATTTPKNPIYI